MKQEHTKTKIVIVCGPTGVGKTGFAVTLAQRFGAEIVGADSMQIYRQMDIGTAKPTALERNAVRHYLVDIVEPDAPFDAAAYAREADKAIATLAGRGVLPLVVGGTGLYIKALAYGLFEGGSTDKEFRKALQARAMQEGTAKMHAELARKDPRIAARIHPNDAYRIIRALEIMALSGRPVSDQQGRHGFASPRYEALQIGLRLSRETLYQRIDKRVDQMMAEGLEQEVRRLLDAGYDRRCKAMQSLGYRHMAAFIQGELSRQEALRTLKRDHRRYAKRQMTWFRAVPDLSWLDPGDIGAAADLITAFLSGKRSLHDRPGAGLHARLDMQP